MYFIVLVIVIELLYPALGFCKHFKMANDCQNKSVPSVITSVRKGNSSIAKRHDKQKTLLDIYYMHIYIYVLGHEDKASR